MEDLRISYEKADKTGTAHPLGEPFLAHLGLL